MREEIQNQCLSEINRFFASQHRGYIHVSPRVGKSKIVIDFLRDKKLKVLLTSPYNSILDSWKKEFEKWGLTNTPKLINQRSLEKEEEKYDFIICDEVHSLSENQRGEILRLKPDNFLGLSGTLSDESKVVLRSILGATEIYEFSIEQAILHNIISDYDITIIPCFLDIADKYIEAGNKKKRFYTTERQQYEFLSKMFNKFKIMGWQDEKYIPVKFSWARKRAELIYKSKTKINVCKQLLNQLQEERKLIFTAYTDIADTLSEYAFHSKSNPDNLDRFIEGEINDLAVCNMVNMGK